MHTTDSSTPAAPRWDIYAPVHKGLRALMMDTLAAVGRADAHDAADRHTVHERVLTLGNACISHLQHENDFVHPVMEARSPGSTAHIAAEHAEHRAAVAELCAMARTLPSARPGQMQHAVQALYRKLALFVAENFVHMHAEEVEHNPVLWAG